jgi:NADPH:quinone reductase-like Zn-dependent oxidoreductase
MTVDKRSQNNPYSEIVRWATTRGRASSATRAVGIRSFGEPLAILEAALHEPKEDEVLIRVAGAGVGAWDTAEQAGAFPLPLPRALGWHGSGTIEAVGAGVDQVRVGDQVVAYKPLAGFFSERVVVPAANVTRAPRNVALADSGVLLLSASTAYQSLVSLARVRRGELVLITAGSGATGTYAVELAKHLGAHVLATTGPGNLAFVRSLGADEVFDYHDDAIAAVRARHPGGVDVLVDCVGPDNFLAHTSVVRAGGRAIGLVGPPPAVPEGVEGHLVLSWERPETNAEVVKLVEEGVLNVRVSKRFSFAQAQGAFDVLATRHGRGSLLLVP